MTTVRCCQHIVWVCDSDCCGEFCLDVVMSYHIQYSSLLFLSQFCMIVSFLYYLKVFLLRNKIICHKENQSFVICQSIFLNGLYLPCSWCFHKKVLCFE